ncbi:hypothetical protein [Dysgonomonas sp. Marseille-P4361]|uniref:hypothetical protein n=1 Tax=Dysgonomonas sp. Marseille-P4361 TaxID=2161820 RepID=UPI000D557AA3|nr:hypothetical protein [Dysgonomonas sp. Marseille-P4361]
MKLSVSYNFFNGEEHLEASVRSIRESVDYITVVYQEKSNSGEPISKEALNVLKRLKELKLVDKLYNYKPNFKKTRAQNELKKRKIGLWLAILKRCTHFFTMDADEFYRKEELEYAKQYIIKNKIASSSVSTFFHLRSVEWRALDSTNCSFITAISWRTKIGGNIYPVINIDPTRKVLPLEESHYHFSVDEVAMYHMNFVRKDKMRSKLNNTSTTDVDFLRKIEYNINSWKPGDIFLFPNKGEFTMEKVDNEFNTFYGERLS